MITKGMRIPGKCSEIVDIHLQRLGKLTSTELK